MDAAELIDFEQEVAEAFEAKKIHAPIHLCSDSQAEPLIKIFRDIKPTDWVLSTWRSHWHALLHGIPREVVMAEILAGHSMSLHFPEYRFMTSAIMGGMLPIACGLAAAGERVHCFIGDMCESTGAFADAWKYVDGHELPALFYIEDNELSTNTPTSIPWGLKEGYLRPIRSYVYKRTQHHSGSGTFVSF